MYFTQKRGVRKEAVLGKRKIFTQKGPLIILLLELNSFIMSLYEFGNR